MGERHLGSDLLVDGLGEVDAPLTHGHESKGHHGVAPQIESGGLEVKRRELGVTPMKPSRGARGRGWATGHRAPRSAVRPRCSRPMMRNASLRP